MRVRVTRSTIFDELPRDYASLVALLPPRPIRDAADEQNVEELVLAMAGHRLSRDQEDYLELLTNLLEKYRHERHPMPDLKSAVKDRLKYLMEHSGMSASDLRALLGVSQPMMSLILSGRRQLSRASIKRLAAHFHLSPAYFI